MVRILSRLHGRAALAWTDTSRPGGRVWLARAGLSPLAVGEDVDGGLWWASNPAWLRHLSHAFDLPFVYLQDSLVAVALPWVASVFGLFLLKQSFEEIPTSLDEAARLDGAGHLRIFCSIILPNVKTALATLCLITFMFSWNAFRWPLIVVQTPEKQVVQVAIAQSVSAGELPDWGMTFAGAAVATVPLVILFLFLQRFFVRGLAASGLR